MDSNQVRYDQARQGQDHEAVNDSNPMKFLLTPEEQEQADYDRRKGMSTYQEYYQQEVDEYYRKAFKKWPEKKTYSPVINGLNSRNLRRIAWAACRPMTTTLDEIIVYFANILDHKKICASCKDQSFCNECFFNKSQTPRREVGSDR